MQLDSKTKEITAGSKELELLAESFHDDQLRLRMMTDPVSVFGTPFSLTAEIKRFAEMMMGDEKFRRGLYESPRATVEAHGLRIDPMTIRAMWDGRAMREGLLTDADMNSDGIRHLNAFNDLKREFFKSMLTKQSANSAFERWRTRQIERCATEMDRANARSIVHAPATFELAAGCSVGCWFCGVSAENYRGAVSYDAIKSIWLDTLAGLNEVIGDAAGKAFLYWGTEPFDNPDYESYCLDLKQVCGGFPQTTTAVPMRDPGRTWELLKLSTAHGCQINRFSILTPRILASTLKTFSPEQLLFVELVLQNKGSMLVKANAGKARNSRKLEDDRNHLARELAEYASPALQAAKPSTIACVSGFLFNLAKKDLRLISPCSASDQHPDGYIVFEEGKFNTGAEAVELMRGMVARHMNVEPHESSLISFRPDFGFVGQQNGFSLNNEYDTVTIQNPNHGPLMRRLGELISTGGHSAARIRQSLSGEFSIDDNQARSVLRFLFDKGLLAERAASETSAH
ncbi:MAG TPA: hypothetical protein DDZ76_03180 [Xanthomonadales bacterium]|nr:hypothetical protein [Xanthomonadales bacterium]